MKDNGGSRRKRGESAIGVSDRRGFCAPPHAACLLTSMLRGGGGRGGNNNNDRLEGPQKAREKNLAAMNFQSS